MNYRELMGQWSQWLSHNATFTKHMEYCENYGHDIAQRNYYSDKVDTRFEFFFFEN